jgi:hypothetical protein
MQAATETEYGDEVPFNVVDDFPETGDLSTQTGNDVIDPAKRVYFTIQEVKPDVYRRDGVALSARLNVRASIGPDGTDGEGKYAKKNLFAELLTWFDPDTYTSDWWRTQARFPYKQFLKALEYDPARPPKVNDDFLGELKGREFVADIIKEEIKRKIDGTYQGTGEFKNVLKNFRKAE